MSCHGCTKKYSFFNKENGCPNCGFSYCSSCIKFKAIIPKLGRTEHAVCRTCHLALSDMMTKNEQPDHPAAFLQKLESLDNPAKPPITLYKRDQKMQQLKSGLSQSETEIADRLEKLREGRKKQRLPSEDEIAERLAVLKGEIPNLTMPGTAKVVLTQDLRSEQQQIDDLLNQYREEQELALNHPSPSEDLANRLAQLRGLDPRKEAGSSDTMVAESCVPSNKGTFGEMPFEDANVLLAQLKAQDMAVDIQSVAHMCIKDTRAQLGSKHMKPTDNSPDMLEESGSEEEQIVEKVLAKAALEEALAMAELGVEETPSSDNEELPWCIICNEDAKKRCEGCSGDLYCDACFKQGHIDEDMKEHKVISFHPKNKTK